MEKVQQEESKGEDRWVSIYLYFADAILQDIISLSSHARGFMFCTRLQPLVPGSDSEKHFGRGQLTCRFGQLEAAAAVA